MERHALYGNRANLYDLIYHWKPYGSEAERLHTLLGDAGVADGARVLEAACGTGQYLVQLAQWYQVAGFDLSPDMLAIAAGKLPDCPLEVADLTDFQVDTPYDAVLCLFSSIGYVWPEDRLHAAARQLFAALRPGGVLIVEPWLTPENFATGRPSLQTYDSPELHLARACVPEVRDGHTHFDFHWLVVPQNGRIEHFQEHHDLALYTVEQMSSAFTAAGFRVEYLDQTLMRDRRLYRCTRPS